MSLAARFWRPALLCLLVVALAGVSFLRASAPLGQPLAYTSCTLDGPVQVIDVRGIAPEDTQPVRMHEDVHATQCAELGWLTMRIRNLTPRGRLTLEAPGYCAGARARLRRGDDHAITRERMLDDANAMFGGNLDSAQVNAALRFTCPDVAAEVSR
jgi:hypothetical protein